MAAEAKARLRSELLAARRAVPEQLRRDEARQIAGHLADALADATVVCAYVPMGTEPGSAEMLDALARSPATVLLPVARTGPDDEPLPLRWGRYVPGDLVAGRFGTREPRPPWLPASALTTADVVLIPALAVDRRGVRLGRGGGFYDRSLPRCAPGARRVAVVRDAEVLEEVPGDSHDVAVTHVLTPGGGLAVLADTGRADGGSST